MGHKSIKFKTIKVKEKHLKNGKIFRDEISNEYKSQKEFIKERSRQQINKLIKFRTILLLDEKIEDPNHHEIVMKGLKAIFPETDPKCFRKMYADFYTK